MAETGGVLWDLDGTLIDSAGHHWVAWRDTLAGVGRSVTEAQFAQTFGKRNDEILRDLFGEGLDPGWVEEVSETKERTYRAILRAEGLDLLPGAEDWLARLGARGWKQALASSAPPRNIEAAFEALRLERFLATIVSADEVGRGKPDPAIFLEAARRIGLPAERCIVVEDAPAGIEGARRAGMPSIGVLSGHHPRLAADLTVPSLAALPDDAFETLLARA
ncbi:MAG: HAD family phosphatase [Vicinamibacteria bacterium]